MELLLCGSVWCILAKRNSKNQNSKLRDFWARQHRRRKRSPEEPTPRSSSIRYPLQRPLLQNRRRAPRMTHSASEVSGVYVNTPERSNAQERAENSSQRPHARNLWIFWGSSVRSPPEFLELCIPEAVISCAAFSSAGCVRSGGSFTCRSIRSRSFGTSIMRSTVRCVWFIRYG